MREVVGEDESVLILKDVERWVRQTAIIHSKSVGEVMEVLKEVSRGLEEANNGE